jgi:hypothetical protein
LHPETVASCYFASGLISCTLSGRGTSRGSLTEETERDGKTNPITIGVLKVWYTQNGDWKLLARQAVRLEEPRTNGATKP